MSALPFAPPPPSVVPAPLFDPVGPTLACPHCGARETAADGFWRAFRPLAVLGRFQTQLHRVFVCQRCRGRFAPLAAVPTRQRPPRDQDAALVYDGAQLLCPKCGRAEARLGPRARWHWFRALPPPPDRAGELATCYRCGDCGHIFAPRAPQ